MSESEELELGTAKLVKKLSGGSWRGDARVYLLNPPLEISGNITVDYVIVSAVNAYGGPETYIFPAHQGSDKPIDWGELSGSYRGGLDHAVALLGAGYQVVS